MRFETESHGLERDRATASERVQHGWQLAIAMLEHLGSRFGIDLRLLVQLLLHHAANDPEEAFAFSLLCLLGGKLIGLRTWIVYCRRKGTARDTGSGSLAHQWWIPFGCGPIPGLLSFAEASLTSGKGRATSMSFFRRGDISLTGFYSSVVSVAPSPSVRSIRQIS